MATDEGNAFEPDPLLEIRMNHSTLKWRDHFALYFTSHRFRLACNEPDPNLDYIRRFFEPGEFLYQDELNEAELDGEAQQLWESSYASWIEDNRQVINRWIVIDLMAHERSLVEILHQERGSVPTDLDDLLRGARVSIAMCLIRQDLWHDPFILLLDRDFPGPALSDADIEDYRRLAAEQSDSIHIAQVQAVHDVQSLLTTHGYTLTAEDSMVVIGLASVVVRARIFPAEVLQAMDLLGTAFAHIARAVDPLHPAWQTVVEKLLGQTS